MKRHDFFCDIQSMVQKSLRFMERHEELSFAIMPIVCYESACHCTLEELKNTCTNVDQAISQVDP